MLQLLLQQFKQDTGEKESIMTLEIPNERQDQHEEHLHEEEKAKHIKDRRGEYYQERREDLSHDADRYDRTCRRPD